MQRHVIFLFAFFVSLVGMAMNSPHHHPMSDRRDDASDVSASSWHGRCYHMNTPWSCESTPGCDWNYWTGSCSREGGHGGGHGGDHGGGHGGGHGGDHGGGHGGWHRCSDIYSARHCERERGCHWNHWQHRCMRSRW